MELWFLRPQLPTGEWKATWLADLVDTWYLDVLSTAQVHLRKSLSKMESEMTGRVSWYLVLGFQNRIKGTGSSKDKQAPFPVNTESTFFLCLKWQSSQNFKQVRIYKHMSLSTSTLHPSSAHQNHVRQARQNVYLRSKVQGQNVWPFFLSSSSSSFFALELERRVRNWV